MTKQELDSKLRRQALSYPQVARAQVEGFRRGGLMATYLTGPLLVLNPPFTKQLLQDLGAEGTLAFEEAAMEAYEARLAEFRDEKRSYLY